MAIDKAEVVEIKWACKILSAKSWGLNKACTRCGRIKTVCRKKRWRIFDLKEMSQLKMKMKGNGNILEMVNHVNSIDKNWL